MYTYRYILIFIVSFLCVSLVQAQQWRKTIAFPNYETVTAVQALPDGGFYLCGTTTPDRAFVCRLTAAGDTLWVNNSHTVGSNLNRILVTHDGGWIACGYRVRSDSFKVGTVTWNQPHQALWLVRGTSNGSLIWAKRYGTPLSNSFFDIAPAPDGGYLLVGGANTEVICDADDYQMFLMKVTETGDSLWKTKQSTIEKIKSTSMRPYTCRFSLVTSNQIVITGCNLSFGYPSSSVHSVFQYITDRNGNYRSSKVFSPLVKSSIERILGNRSNTLGDYSSGGIALASGDILWCGTANVDAGDNNVSGTRYGYDGFLMRTNSLGDTLWTRRSRMPGNDDNRLILPVPGGAVVGGTRWSGWNYDFSLTKLNLNGDTIWDRHYGDGQYCYLKFVALANDGGYLLCGDTDPTNQAKLLLIKVDSSGSRSELSNSKITFDRELRLGLSCEFSGNCDEKVVFELPKVDSITVSFFDEKGRKLFTEFSSRKRAGRYSIPIDYSSEGNSDNKKWNSLMKVMYLRMDGSGYSVVRKIGCGYGGFFERKSMQPF